MMSNNVLGFTIELGFTIVWVRIRAVHHLVSCLCQDDSLCICNVFKDF